MVSRTRAIFCIPGNDDANETADVSVLQELSS